MVCYFQDRVPFAVVGSNTVVESNGRKVRGRVYPWGVVEGKNADKKAPNMLTSWLSNNFLVVALLVAQLNVTRTYIISLVKLIII